MGLLVEKTDNTEVSPPYTTLTFYVSPEVGECWDLLSGDDKGVAYQCVVDLIREAAGK